jgi:hypothetical protein
LVQRRRPVEVGQEPHLGDPPLAPPEPAGDLRVVEADLGPPQNPALDGPQVIVLSTGHRDLLVADATVPGLPAPWAGSLEPAFGGTLNGVVVAEPGTDEFWRC